MGGTGNPGIILGLATRSQTFGSDGNEEKFIIKLFLSMLNISISVLPDVLGFCLICILRCSFVLKLDLVQEGLSLKGDKHVSHRPRVEESGFRGRVTQTAELASQTFCFSVKTDKNGHTMQQLQEHLYT